MKILLTGGSGFVGRYIAGRLAEEGYTVIKASRATGVDFLSLQKAEHWLPHLSDIDVVINCVGIIAEKGKQRFDILHDMAPRALFKACELQKIKRVIQISALGAEHVSTPYQISKNHADQALKQLNLEWVILKPSLIYGEGGSSDAMFRMMALLPIIPLIDHGKQQIQPIHINDVVEATLASLSLSPAHQEIALVGPTVYTFVDWLQLIRKKNGKKRGLTVSSPYFLVKTMSHFAKYLFPMLHPDNLQMLQQGNVADVHGVRKLLGRSPIAAEEVK